MIDDFFLTLTVGEPFRGKDFKLKKYGLQGYFLKKRKLLMQNKDQKQPPVIIL